MIGVQLQVHLYIRLPPSPFPVFRSSARIKEMSQSLLSHSVAPAFITIRVDRRSCRALIN